MVDKLTPDKRSRLMASIGQKNTKPELAVRSALHRLGYRFRLHRKDLPGRPDIVLPRYRVIILVHGCFWHQHRGCSLSSRPTTNSAFWQEKFRANKERDERNVRDLEAMGWRVHIIWECETKNRGELIRRLEGLLRKESLAPTGRNDR